MEPLIIVSATGALVSVITAVLDFVRNRGQESRRTVTVTIAKPDGAEFVMSDFHGTREQLEELNEALQEASDAAPPADAGAS